MALEYLLYSFLFVLIGLMLVSFFLVWHWFDARNQVAIVREHTRDETIRAIRFGHNKCRVLLYSSLFIAACAVPLPFLLREHYSSLVYPAVVAVVDIIILVYLRIRVKNYLASLDDYIAENEQHVREANEEVARLRQEWIRQAPELNPIALEQIRQTLGDTYETWFEHDILVGRNVMANTELGLLYAQGIVIPFSEIMEVRQGRRDLKLVTSNSEYPFITIDFGTLPINPETGRKYKDEIAERINKLI